MKNPQEVIRNFVSGLANHSYTSASDFTAKALDNAVASSSNFGSLKEVKAAMKADQLAAEREAVEQILGSAYAGKTMADLSSSLLQADATLYDLKKISHAYYNEWNDKRTTVERVIKEVKARIFLEKYCGIQLERKYWLNSSGNLTWWLGDLSGNVDTGAITGSDANITLKAGDVVEGKVLTADLMKKLAAKEGARLEGDTLIIGTGTEKTDRSVIPEIGNKYTAATSQAQNIKTGSNDWIVTATNSNDTITSSGADSIDASNGNDQIIVLGDHASVKTGAGADNVQVDAEVKFVTLEDLNSSDVLTISGNFEVGNAKLEDSVLTVTDKTGTRTIRFSDFENAKNAKVNGTTVANWLAKAGVSFNTLKSTLLATPSEVNPLAKTKREKLDGARADIDPEYKPSAVQSVRSGSKKQNLSAARNANSSDAIDVDLDTVTLESGSLNLNGNAVGKISSEFPNISEFHTRGLTVKLAGVSSDTNGDPDTVQAKTLDELTDDQKAIVAGLFKWWAKEGLKLNEESYGLSFSSPTAMVNEIGLYFYDGKGQSNALASVWNWQRVSSDGVTTKLMLNVNMDYYRDLAATNVDGESSGTSALLDRTLSHEENHALLAANIRYFQKLPKYVKEGLAELVHGIDDERANRIFTLAYDSDLLSAVLDETNTGSDIYSGGYMFFRYLSRKAALQSLFDDTEPEDASIIILTEGNDNYSLTADGKKVEARGGDDEIQISGDNSTVDGGNGNDSLINGEVIYSRIINPFGSNETINSTGGTNVSLFGGAGNDFLSDKVYEFDSAMNRYTLTAANVNNTLDGGEGNDSLVSSNNAVTLLGGAGDDSMQSSGSKVLLDGGAGSNTINSSGDSSTITAGDGDNKISNTGRLLSIITGNGDNVINNGFPADGIGSNSSITTGLGNDTIINYSDNVRINAGDGNNFVAQHGGKNSSATTGNGSDTIAVSGETLTVKSGAGDDSITGWYDHASSIDAGDGSDTIQLGGSDDAKETVDAGADDDLIRNGDGCNSAASNLTIIGGKGNDYFINHDGQNVTFIHRDGDDSDTIEGVNETFTLVTDTYSKEIVDDENILIKVSDGSILLLGAANLSTVHIVGVEIENDTEPFWTINGTTATYGTPNKTLATLTGLKKGLSVEDGQIDGISVDENIITLSENVLGTSKVSVTGDYILALDEDVTTADSAESTEQWTVSGTKVYLKLGTAAHYSLSDDEKSVSFSKAKFGKTVATISGLKKNLKAVGGAVDGISFDGETITLGANVLGTSKVTIKGDYNLALADDVQEPLAEESVWSVKNTTATLKFSTAAGYILSDDEKSIAYSKATKNKTLATLTGLKKGLSVEDGQIDGISVDDNIITLSDNVLGSSKVSVTGDYILALDEDVTTADSAESTEQWTVSGTKVYLKLGTAAHYSLSDDEKSVSFSKAKFGKTVATISGLKKNLKAVGGAVDGISFDGETITLGANVLGTSKVTIKGDYNLALADDVQTAEHQEFAWTRKSKTATLSQKNSAGYILSDDEKSIAYSKATTATLATVKGVKRALSEENFFDEKVFLTSDDINNKVTVSGSVAFEFADDYSKAKITGSAASDTITVLGTGNSVVGGKGDDIFYGGAGGNTFLHAAGSDGDDVIVDFTAGDKFKVTKGKINSVTVAGEDILVEVKNGKNLNTVTLQDAAYWFDEMNYNSTELGIPIDALTDNQSFDTIGLAATTKLTKPNSVFIASTGGYKAAALIK